MTIRTSVCFALTGDSLEPKSISRTLGIDAHESWVQGETFSSAQSNERTRPWGVWKLYSLEDVDAQELDAHIDWLLKKLEGRKLAIDDLGSSQDVTAEVFLWEKPSYGITLSSKRLRALADISDHVRFVSFDE